MPSNQTPILRSHALQRLLRLTPENTDVESLDRFISERSQILAELEAISDPWTEEEHDILELAMRHAENIMSQLTELHQKIAQQIGGMQGAARWGESATSGPPRVTRRY